MKLSKVLVTNLLNPNRLPNCQLGNKSIIAILLGFSPRDKAQLHPLLIYLKSNSHSFQFLYK